MKTATARFASTRVGSLLLAIALLIMPAASIAGVFVSVDIAPPVLPVYVQPPVPGPGYIWTPGYWAYGPDGYYWVPGTWVLAPYYGALWTPGYWGWGGAAFLWHAGYWGPRVGFYGGVNYGFGYTGVGFYGGSWSGNTYNYNTAVTNVNVTNIHNTYNQSVAVQNSGALSRVSYNGGTGGISAQPTAQERLAESDRHLPATQLQARHEQLASTNRSLLASVNHGTPTLAATPKAAAIKPQYGSTVTAGHQQYANTVTAGHQQGQLKKSQITQGQVKNAPLTQGQVKNAPLTQGPVKNAPLTQGPGKVAPLPQGHPQSAPHPQGQHKEEHHEEGHPR